MDALGQLKYFVRAAELGSFSRAAEEARVKPSSVSRAVTELERRLGAAVFNRSTRSLHLTEIGGAFLGRARKILDDLDDAYTSAAAFNAKPQGVLRLNVPGAFGRLHVLPYLRHFMAQYPDIEIDVTLSDALVDIIESGTDLAIRIGALPDSQLMARKLAPHRRILCASPGFLAANPPVTKPADLANLPALLFTQNQPDRWSLVDAQGQREDIICTGRLRANDSQALQKAALDGLGIALLPSWIAGEAVRSGALTRLFSDYQIMFGPGERFIWAVYPPKRVVAPKVRVFIDGFAAHIGAPPYWDSPTG